MLNILTRRLLWAVILSFGAFILWIVPSFLVLSRDSNYAERVLREAELVATAIARGGMARKPSSKIGANPRDPRIIAAKARSPFHRNRAEGIIRQMHAITHKRIVLYDHRKRIVMDSYNFHQAKEIDVQSLSDLTSSQPLATAITAPDYISPPRGDDPFVLAALTGRSLIREIIPEKEINLDLDNEPPQDSSFHPRQPMIQAAAPIRRLKLVEGAVVLIDDRVEERIAWRWQALFDGAPFFAATLVALLLLLLWLQSVMIGPLSKLAYNAQPSKTGRSDEIHMIAQRQLAGKIAVQNFSETAQAFAKMHRQEIAEEKMQEVADSEIAAKIHSHLIGAKMEMTNLMLIVRRCIRRHNGQIRKKVLTKMNFANASQALPFSDPVRLEKVDANNVRHAFRLPLFAQSLEISLDYLIQSATVAQGPYWPSSVRISLVREKKYVRFAIEDDGEDIESLDLKTWIMRAYDKQEPPLWTLRAIETVFAMHNGRMMILSKRPPRLAIILPLALG